MDDYNDDGGPENRPGKDPRVALMERLVGMEEAHRAHQIDAKEAAARVQRIATEIANAKNELYKLLGVVSEDEARAVRVSGDR